MNSNFETEAWNFRAYSGETFRKVIPAKSKQFARLDPLLSRTVAMNNLWTARKRVIMITKSLYFTSKREISAQAVIASLNKPCQVNKKEEKNMQRRRNWLNTCWILDFISHQAWSDWWLSE